MPLPVFPALEETLKPPTPEPVNQQKPPKVCILNSAFSQQRGAAGKENTRLRGSCPTYSCCAPGVELVIGMQLQAWAVKHKTKQFLIYCLTAHPAFNIQVHRPKKNIRTCTTETTRSHKILVSNNKNSLSFRKPPKTLHEPSFSKVSPELHNRPSAGTKSQQRLHKDVSHKTSVIVAPTHRDQGKMQQPVSGTIEPDGVFV